MEGLKLKDSNWDEEAITVKLEKQGFDLTVAKQVAKDICIERENDAQNERSKYYNIGLTLLAIGVLIQVISVLVFPGFILVPIGLVVTGLIMTIFSLPKKKK